MYSSLFFSLGKITFMCIQTLCVCLLVLQEHICTYIYMYVHTYVKLFVYTPTCVCFPTPVGRGATEPEMQRVLQTPGDANAAPSAAELSREFRAAAGPVSCRGTRCPLPPCARVCAHGMCRVHCVRSFPLFQTYGWSLCTTAPLSAP